MVFVKWDKGGKCRKNWYMRVRRLDNPYKFQDIRLDVLVKGTPPTSRKSSDKGDEAFERSRVRAEEKSKEYMIERKVKGASEDLLRKLYKDKTGHEAEYVRLDQLGELWRHIAREREPSKKRMQISATVFRRFANFCALSKVYHLYEVTPKMATEFFQIIREKLAWSTVKDQMTLLSGAFNRFLPHGLRNPFKGILKRSCKADSRQIHKAALTDDKLAIVLEEAKKFREEFMYPITVCAACTGMRIGDVCNLQWNQISDDNHIQVVTSKAGIFVNIPIFPELKKVLDGLLVTKDPGERFVFPEAAEMYKHNQSGIYRRGKKLMANALFSTPERELDVTDVVDGKLIPPMSNDEVFAAIDKAKYSPGKAERLKEVFLRRISGESYTTISKELGKSKGQISGDLLELEILTKLKLRPTKSGTALAERLRKTCKSHKTGKNAVSIYGWHSFRATFATAAKRCGVSDETIIQIIGHTSFKTTENYIDLKTLEADRELEKMSRTKIGLGYESHSLRLPMDFSNDDMRILAELKSLPEDKKAAIAKALSLHLLT